MAEVEGEIGNNEAASGAAPPSSFVSRPLVGIKSRSSSTLDANRRTIICIGPAIVAGAAASDCTMRYVNGRQRETSAVQRCMKQLAGSSPQPPRVPGFSCVSRRKDPIAKIAFD